MTPEERYLFDLQGYLVVRGALPTDLLRRLNESVDALEALSDDKTAALGVPGTTRSTASMPRWANSRQGGWAITAAVFCAMEGPPRRWMGTTR